MRQIQGSSIAVLRCGPVIHRQVNTQQGFQLYSVSLQQTRQTVHFCFSEQFMIEVAPSSPCRGQEVTRWQLSQPWNELQEYHRRRDPYDQNPLQVLRHFPTNNTKNRLLKSGTRKLQQAGHTWPWRALCVIYKYLFIYITIKPFMS